MIDEQIQDRLGIWLYELVLIDNESIEATRSKTIIGILSSKKLSIFIIIPEQVYSWNLCV